MAIFNTDKGVSAKPGQRWRIAAIVFGALCLVLSLFLIVGTEQRAIVEENASTIRVQLEQEKRALKAMRLERERDNKALREENNLLRQTLKAQSDTIRHQKNQIEDLENQIESLVPAPDEEN